MGVQPRDQGCMGGLHFFSLEDPSNPVALGCDGQDGYVHDVGGPQAPSTCECDGKKTLLTSGKAQCVIYRGPDAKYFGRDICYGYNEDTLTMCVKRIQPYIASGPKRDRR